MSNELIVKDNSNIVRAELDTQITTANAYPRDEMEAIEKAIKFATIDEETAQGCFYVLPRTGKDGQKVTIEGDSIRLAEIVRCAWKHMHTQTRIIEIAEKYITTEAVCWDLQNNNKHIATDRISIWFGEDLKKGKPGYRANNDMQIMLSKASQAKALRNAIFQVIPKALVKVVSSATKKFAIGNVNSINTKIIKVVDKLVKMGVEKQAILDYFGQINFNDFTAEDYQSLIGIGTALKEGMIKPEEVFKQESNAPTGLTANQKINDLIANKKKLEPNVNHESQELYNQVKKQLLNAKSQETLDLAADLIKTCDPIFQEELRKIFSEKSDE